MKRPMQHPLNSGSLSPLFSPRSVALVGASSDPAKIGYRLAANILSQPFSGSVFFVNPKGTSILDRKAHRSVACFQRAAAALARWPVPGARAGSGESAMSRKTVPMVASE